MKHLVSSLISTVLPSIVVATLAVTMLLPPLALGQASDEEVSAQVRARELWEKAIAAKGGRERLYAVTNLQISIREKVSYKFKSVPYLEEDLYVFPNKSWEWNDQRETIF